NSAASDSRFRSRDELKYSIRSVLMYASWVRNIYIVTDSQVPDWLVECKKVIIIDHKDIFPDHNVLPVFNSHAIESNLHKIDGLSDCFLYFNDDVFLGKKVEKSDFFTPFGKASKFFLSDATFIPFSLSCDSLPVDVAARNNMSFLNEKFNFKSQRKFKHTPISLKVSTLSRLERDYSQIFDLNRKQRVRSKFDYSIVSSLYHYYSFSNGTAFPSNTTYSYINLGDYDYKVRLTYMPYKTIKNRAKMFCVNDVDSDHLPQLEINQVFRNTMESLYPFKSPVEK
ncbi:stealth conserved region 3 domain-containing protein, partial [Photobacterium makurazakiensis]|uniref:stealth conserved region 3 domain-containing protein n=1 Tax=Photobacterium makurazakiensis TaxID=2910234 RepID=UPI003D0B0E91